jgi:hypothetical protein
MPSARLVLIIGFMMVLGLVGCQPVRSTEEMQQTETSNRLPVDELQLSDLEVNLGVLKLRSYVDSGGLTHTNYAELFEWCAPGADIDGGVPTDPYSAEFSDLCPSERVLEWLEEHNQACDPAEKPDEPICYICKPCLFYICVDGEWKLERMGWEGDPLCEPRPGPSPAPWDTCPRDPATGVCPAECDFCS